MPQANPGFNNTPFKFTKYSNAYMLVYIRESDKDKIICNVDEKDIAEHLRVSAVRFIILLVFHIMVVLGLTHYFSDKIKERTRRERTQEKGKGRGTSLHHHKGFSFNFLLDFILY